MILVDSSVWIAHLRGERTRATAKLEAASSRQPLLIGDLILLEVLQGAWDESHAACIERGLCRYTLVPLLHPDLAPRAAGNYRTLQGRGITIRKTADIIIGAFCIEHHHSLLHDDRDFCADGRTSRPYPRVSRWQTGRDIHRITSREMAPIWRMGWDSNPR